MSSSPGPAMELLGRIAYELYQMKPLIPTYIHLLISAIFPIYTAAHASLARPPSAAPIEKKDGTDIGDLQDEEISPTIETLQPSDAILFPVLAGTVLASLYFVLKWLQDPALLNYYLGLYFALVGMFFTIKFIKDGLTLLRSAVLPSQYSYHGNLWKLIPNKQYFAAVDKTKKNGENLRKSPLPGSLSILFKKNSALWTFRRIIYTKLQLKFSILKLISVVTVVDTLDFAGLAIAAPLVAYHTFIDKPWFLTNLLGFSFCYGSLQITTPGTSWTGSLLLIALFFYDIYFVFFTPMMVTVATKLDIPIKLLFPRPDGCILPVGAAEGSQAMEEYLKCLAKKRTMAMLGLGDIVIPGMMLAFALRFDLYMYYRKLSALAEKSDSNADKSSEGGKVAYLPATGSWGERFWTSTGLQPLEMKAKQFPKTYFNASVIGYVLSMITTVVVMQISQHAQPALLYLVPGVLLSIWGTALVKGDFKTLWNYSEVPEDDDDEKKKEIEDNKDEKEIEDAKDEKEGEAATEVETIEQQDQDSKSSTATVPSNPTKSDESLSAKDQEDVNLADDAEIQHVIYFSLSVINERKQKIPSTAETTTTPNPPKSTTPPSSTSSSTADKTPATDSQDSSDEFDISSGDEQQFHDHTPTTIEEILPATDKPESPSASTPTPREHIGTKQVTHVHVPDHDSGIEPVVKRRRKV